MQFRLSKDPGRRRKSEFHALRAQCAGSWRGELCEPFGADAAGQGFELWERHGESFRRILKNRTRCGAILLEVVLALVLFAAAAAIIGAGIHSAVNGVERQKLNAHAVNLAVSVISEIQMGLRTLESVGPEPFDSPFDQWTWQLVLAPAETEAGEPGELTHVEVIVRHQDPALVHRLTQVLKLEKNAKRPMTAANYQP